MLDKEKAFMDTVGELARRHHREMQELEKSYAMENNPYSVGDIVGDPDCRIKITRIEYGKKPMNGIPECIYYGQSLKKDNTPRVKPPHNESIRQGNITYFSYEKLKTHLTT